MDLRGRTSELVFTVTDADTAAALGSGSLAVLGTPRLLAWAEQATCAATADVLEEGSTTVGTRIELEHLAASPVGARVRVTAALSHQDGRLLRFDVAAYDEATAKLLGSGRVTRVLVQAERFLDRVNAR